MSTLYALERGRIGKKPEGQIEVVDLDSLSLHTIIPLEFTPSSLAVSAGQQRLYVVDRAHARVWAHDTTGKIKAQIAMPSAPYDCVLTGDASLLLVSTDDGLAVIDTAKLQLVKTVAGPAAKVGTTNADTQWLPASLALSPDSSQLAVVDGRPHDSFAAPPMHLWLVDVASLKTIGGFDLPSPPAWVSLESGPFPCDVVYAGGTGQIVVAGTFDSVTVVNTQTKTISPWIELKKSNTERGEIRRWSNCLHYSAKANDVFITTGLGPKIASGFQDYQPGDPAPPWVVDGSALWTMSPDASSLTWTAGFGAAVGVACLDPKESSVLVSVTNTWYIKESGQIKPDTLARYTIGSQAVAPTVYTFSGDDYINQWAVISMQAVTGSPLDPAPHFKEFYAEQSVAILIGLIGGGSGWVIGPNGIISPVDPEPFRPSARELRDAVQRVLRAGLLVNAAGNIADRLVREQVQRRALDYATQQLAQVKRTGGQ